MGGGWVVGALRGALRVGGSFRTLVIFCGPGGLALFFVLVYYQHYIFFLRHTGRQLAYFGGTTSACKIVLPTINSAIVAAI